MLYNPVRLSKDLLPGVTIELETGKLAKQADGSVVLRVGKMMILATVVAENEYSTTSDFFPLRVDYIEKFAAAGRFPGGFIKREARPSNSEILISRLVDRALRPMFPKGYFAETQLLIYLMSSDPDILPDAYACIAGSAALLCSDIPLETAISEVRIGRINNQFVINPKIQELEDSDIDIIVAGSEDSIVMVEGESSEITEKELIECLKFGHNYIKELCNFQKDFAEKSGKLSNIRKFEKEITNEALENKVVEYCYNKLIDITRAAKDKKERGIEYLSLYKSFIAENNIECETDLFISKRKFEEIKKETTRDIIINEKVRLDGRTPKEIREIACEVDLVPGSHGSSLFTRGETQSLTTITLGSKTESQTIDGVVLRGEEKFMLHYNFPPFSTGEAKPLRGVSRREIGHGNLALRALRNVVNESGSPYTIRVVSDILESNGSSSMATVCAGSLALMDAGIKIKKHIGGIAMGLITKGDKYVILSDILGDEDHLGDMDFKITGSKEGITACQMDIKIKGLSWEVLENALEQAKEGRLHIIDKLYLAIEKTRNDYKSHAPRIVEIIIKKEQIGELIGPSGKTIQGIQKESNTTITIEEAEGDKGIVEIMSPNKENLDIAVNKIKHLFEEPEIGKVYEGKVKTITEYGAFVEFLPKKEALLHISEIDWQRVNDVNDYMKKGDIIKVKLIGVDPKTKKYKLSMKVLTKKN